VADTVVVASLRDAAIPDAEESLFVVFCPEVALTVDVNDENSESDLDAVFDDSLRSDFDTSVVVLDFDVSDAAEMFGVLDCLCCVHRPRTPSTAFKKLVEPDAKVRTTASRAGANCWSSFRSWIPSDKRRPRSATTEGFSVQGCLARLSLSSVLCIHKK